MDKHIGAIILRNEPVTFLIIKPLDGTSCHVEHPPDMGERCAALAARRRLKTALASVYPYAVPFNLTEIMRTAFALETWARLPASATLVKSVRQKFAECKSTKGCRPRANMLGSRTWCRGVGIAREPAPGGAWAWRGRFGSTGVAGLFGASLTLELEMVSMIWTDHMCQALVELQRRPLLRHLLVFAKEQRVELYAVGGVLRDIGLGRVADDVDVAMIGDTLEFARAFANRLRAAYVPMDVERGEVRVVHRKRDVLDFARIRGDSIVTDLYQRDFTINAMACPLSALLSQDTPVLIDPHGGWPDLQGQTIRLVSPASFRDDPLRQLRAFRLAATLDFSIDPATLAAMAPVVPCLSEVAAERIHRELLRLFAAPRSSPHVAAMARLGLLNALFPELVATFGSTAQPDHRSLIEHAVQTYQAVEALINDPGSQLQPIAAAVVKYFRVREHQALVKWAALLHVMWDAGLDQPVDVEPGIRGLSGEVQTELWEQIGSRLKLSSKQIDYVKTLNLHYRAVFQLALVEAQGLLTLRTVYRWSRAVEDHMLALFILAIGHALAQGPGRTAEPSALLLTQLASRLWDLYHQRILPVLTAPRLLSGHDLQQLFQLPPGPRYKVLLDELEAARVEGRIRTRAEALQWVEQQLR
jgi:poly(A) polymerase